MKLGIGSYTYTWAVGVPGHPPHTPMGPRELVERAVGLGVQVVQFSDNLPLTGLPAADLSDLARILKTHGLQVELGTRGLEAQDLRAHLDLARRFGSPFVRVVVDKGADEPSPDEVVQRLAPFALEFRRAGKRLAIENHDRFSARTLARWVGELGEDWVGVCLDTVNSFGALEGPEVVVAALAPYALNLHVKDFTIRRVPSQMGYVVEGCPVGAGRLDVPWLLGALRAAGRDVNAIVELWTPPAETVEGTLAREADWAEASVRYLRRFIVE